MPDLTPLEVSLSTLSPIVGELGGFPRLRPGVYYTSPQVGGQGISDLAMTEAQQTFIPFYLSYETTFSKIGVILKSNGGAAEVVRLGVYRDDGYGAPNAVMFDAATVAVSAGASVIKEISIVQTLEAGLWWLSAAAQGASGTPPTVCAVDFPAPAPVDIISSTSLTSCTGYTLAGITGAFAATAYASLTKTTSKLPGVIVKI